ncbi:MAG: M20 family metallopeptidase [Lachnospiraceae bacterium]
MEDKEKLITEALELVENIKPDILSISHIIHANPEPAFQEFKAAKLLQNFVELHGFHVKRGDGELSTAIRACREGKKGIKIAFLSEYDALPNGHACGHNLIAATGVAAAVVFDQIIQKYNLPASCIFLGTPAEEGGGGKIKMLNAGFFDGIDYAMMIHPADRTMVEDWSLAGQQVHFKFYGQGAHCAASPWLGANALEAAVQTMNLVNGWRCQFKDYTRVHGIIVQGGEATNVIPKFAELHYNVRSDQKDYQKDVMDIVIKCAQCAADAFGVKVEHDLTFAYEPICNNKILEKHMAESFRLLGETVEPRMRDHGIGSTDMGNVSQRLPAIHGHLKLAEENTHTDAFREAAGGDAGDRYAIVATKAMVMTAIGLLVENCK